MKLLVLFKLQGRRRWDDLKLGKFQAKPGRRQGCLLHMAEMEVRKAATAPIHCSTFYCFNWSFCHSSKDGCTRGTSHWGCWVGRTGEINSSGTELNIPLLQLASLQGCNFCQPNGTQVGVPALLNLISFCKWEPDCRMTAPLFPGPPALCFSQAP